MSQPKPTAPRAESPLKSVMSTLGTEVVLFPLIIVVGALITRYLGPTDKGIYTFIILIYGIFVSLIMVGNSGSTHYYLSNKEYTVKEIFGSLLLMTFYFSVIATIAVYTLWYMGWLGKTGAAITHTQIIIILISIPPTIANLLFMRVFVGTSQFVLKNKTLLTFRFVQLGLLLLFAFVINYRLTGIIIAVMLAKITYLIIQLRFILKHYAVDFSFDRTYLKKAHTYGIQIWLNELIKVSNNRIDQFIIGIFLAPELLGFFSISVVVCELAQKVPSTTLQIFFNQTAKSDDRQRKYLLERLHKLNFWVTFLAGIFLTVAGYWLIVLMYGRAFEFSYTILLYYLPGAVIFMSTRVFLVYFSACGKPLKNTWIHLSGILVGIPAYILLIGKMGVIGAAIGSTLAYFATNITALYLYQKETNGFSLNIYKMNKDDWQWVGNKYHQVTSKLKNKLKP